MQGFTGENLKKTLAVCALALALFVGYEAATLSFQGEFTILYSLDRKENDRAVVAAIDNAKSYAYFAVYTFTKSNIAEALVQAKKRGVDVRGITDAGQSQGALEAKIVKKLEAAGIPVETQKHPQGIMHIKMLVTDNAYALGSYNWTESATNLNDEVLEIGTDGTLRRRYLAIVKEVLAANQ